MVAVKSGRLGRRFRHPRATAVVVFPLALLAALRGGAASAQSACPYVYPYNCSGCEAPVNTAVYAYFPGPLDPNSVTSATFTVAPSNSGVPTGPALPGEVSYDPGSRAAIFRPATALAPNASYLLTSGPGLRYEDGTSMDSPCFRDFRTAGAADQVPPRVVYWEPTVVSSHTTPKLEVQFSEYMDPSTVNAATFLVGDGVEGTVTYEPVHRRAILVPTRPFPEDVDVTAMVTSGVRDAAGNPLGEPFTWTFHVPGGGLLDPPEVVETVPDDQARGVALNTAIQVFFDEDLDPATINPDTFRIDGGVTGTVDYSPLFRVATFYPAAPLAPHTAYTVTIAADVQDAAGYRAGSDHVWGFETGEVPDTEAPTVASEWPARGSTRIGYHGVPEWWGVAVASIRFSEAVDFQSLQPGAILYDGRPTRVWRDSVDEGGITIGVQVSEPQGTKPVRHRLTVTSAVRDLAGNPFPADETWTFYAREATPLEDCLYDYPSLGEDGCRSQITSGGGGGGGGCFLETLGNRVIGATGTAGTASRRVDGAMSGGER